MAVREVSANGAERLLSDAGHEESPSFAPNSRWVMYATRSGGRDSLVAASVDCLLYTSDAAHGRTRVELGGGRII